jgi:hypothetical protein
VGDEMKMVPKDLEPEEGIKFGKLIQFVIISAMVFALFFRYMEWVSTHSNIPPGGDPPSYSHTAIPQN